MTHEEIIDRLRMARVFTAEHLPWFAPALFQARIVLTKQVYVAAVDRSLNVYWNPAAVERIAEGKTLVEMVKELGFLWLHEIAHVLREHADRAEEREAEAIRWNIAADLEINDGIWEPFAMPATFPGLLPAQFKLSDGLLAEEYYEALPHVKLRHLEMGFGDEGSGVHGQPCPWESASSCKSDSDADDPNSGRQRLHPMDIELIKRQVAVEMERALASGRIQGNMPLGWRRWIEKVLRSKTDWRKVLRHRMSVAIATGVGARVDYTFSRPNRRQAAYAPVITPSFSGDRSARVACVVDTSGSIGTEELATALGEIFAVLQAFHVPVTVIPCDAEVYESIVLKKPSDVFKIRDLPGGGGTDMVVGIGAALRLLPKPDSVLVLTDGYTPYPDKPYTTPVVFGILCPFRDAKIPLPPIPPWSEEAVVWIEMNEK